MKLLDWMHHKFRHTNNEHLTEFAPRKSCTCPTGQPSVDELQYYHKSQYYTKTPSNNIHRNNQFRKSFACIETARADNEQIEEESDDALSEIFHGFLTIGTLATEPLATEPETPTFTTCVENIMDKKTEATENELKLINDELEKVFGLERKEDQSNDSSGRNSCVSAGRSSHGSTITLGGRSLEGPENDRVVCPLQGYLFGSVVELPETTITKKEHRASLGELFQKTKMVEETTRTKINGGEKQKDHKEADKSSVHLMRKILKGYSSRRSTSASGGTVDSASVDKKHRKIIHMFHRKVHPEGSDIAPKSVSTLENNNNNNQTLTDDITLFPLVDTSKKVANFTKRNVPRSSFCMNESYGNKECWIKSDSEYLVLEL